MEKVFINHTNHTLAHWSEEQKKAALQWGPIVEIPFPAIDPSLTSEEVRTKAEEMGEKLLSLHPAAVLCQGEFTYTWHMVQFLKNHGIPALAACSRRVTREWTDEEGSHKEALFRFVQFRSY